jgi:hypothetical protein
MITPGRQIALAPFDYSSGLLLGDGSTVSDEGPGFAFSMRRRTFF